MSGGIRRLALVTTLASAIVFTPAAISATSPSVLFSSILISGARQHSVHYVSVQSAGGNSTVQVADIGANQGIQRITYTSNGQTGHVTVLVTGDSAYVHGDAFALVNYMGYKAEVADQYAEHWIRIPSTDPDYNAVSGDVTLPSLMSDLYVPPPLKLTAKKTLGGKAVIGVTGTRPATAKSAAVTFSLYAQGTGLLPVEEDIVQGSFTAKVTYSHWNERVQIAAPPLALPISITGLEGGTICACA